MSDTIGINLGVSGRTFYVIARPEENRFAPANGTGGNGWVKTVEETKHYATVQDAFRAFGSINSRSRYSGDFYPLDIIKVTEVPGTTTRRIIASRVVDLSKPVVIFTPTTGLFAGYSGPASTLKEARLFADGSDAISHMVQFSIDKGREGTVIKAQSPIHLVNVETIVTPPTFTQTVLQ